MKGPFFYSKILLFGEYGIIKDSKGLSIPYNHFKGSLKISDLDLSILNKKSHKKIKEFLGFLKSIDLKSIDFDWDKINNDIKKNIYFDSTIPQGYGIGSSGALVASVYERYAKNKVTDLENLTKKKLHVLKLIFSQMESFFHGKSSGLDPLNSYLCKPILVNSRNNIELTGIPSQNKEGKGAVFLLDSGESGKTAPMISLFMEKMKNDSFSKMINDQFISATNKCVENFLDGNYKNLFLHLKKLSELVFNDFKPMIPNQFKDLWLNGINTNSYYLKLCGSGGGGYILGFTQDWTKAQKELLGHDLQVIFNF